MNTYFIFYIETKEVVAMYHADQIDLNAYVVTEGPQIGHARQVDNASPYDCEIVKDNAGDYIAKPKEV